MKITGSFTKSIFDTKTTIDKLEESNVDYIHIDLMDGKFVANKQQMPSELLKLFKNNKKPLDVHIMALNPTKYLSDFAFLNTEYYTFHFEAVKNVEETINEIMSVGFKVGISIKPDTKVEEILKYLPLLNQILIMSVNPGEGGQTFLETSLEKIEILNKLKNENNYSYIISVDGGINDETAKLVEERGADMVVVGSFITMSDNFNEQIEAIKQDSV